jgi:hypothetical protein
MEETGMKPTNKYPQGYFKEKQCKTCSEIFTPTNPCNIYCKPECKGKNAYYKRNYGITDRDLAKMKEEQDNKCYICDEEGFLIGKNNNTEKLAVDHCHKTGKVRKLLCHNCNRGLGLFQDNIELLKAAAAYLKEHNGKH